MKGTRTALLLLLGAFGCTLNHVLAFLSYKAHSSFQRQIHLCSTKTPAVVVESEVVGANGRMGSLLLSKTARAVPRGVAPGCLSPIGTPIYVATPARVWSDILHQTLTERKEDLVWIGNGLPPPTVTTTVVVPHFGVLERYGDPVTSPTSPSTLIYGKHAVAVENLLRRKGIHNVQLVSSYDDILIAAARKLLWAASMWLLCHSTTESVLTVAEVHRDRQNELEILVRTELFTALFARYP